ncbi:hypothetical protein [Thetidibacter halocola]|uniref:Uncharacterized protein n=1 Tax=Thetidibacter halocola TaxID=2827239 RepID=A0A8J8BA58_9RHOB|nr:hypothetical protein [Thetidibacter halocola]MBS0124848.1 hypothetical protein [Thetidibacter halocola]
MPHMTLSPDAVFVSCRSSGGRPYPRLRPILAGEDGGEALDRLGDRIEQMEYALAHFLSVEGEGPLAARLDAIEARLDALLSPPRLPDRVAVHPVF